VIEDNEAVREEVADILRFENFDVTVAENGRDGLEAVRRVLPDVVLCDLMMPELDGYGTLEALRADPTTASIPFVCLTARAERPDTRRAMELGADDYIVKPFTTEDLLRGLTAAIERRARSRDASEAKLTALKETLSSTLPHELRTPLTAILGHAEILADPEHALDPHDVMRTARYILDAGLRLNRLTENFFLYAQLGVLGRGTRGPEAWEPIDCVEIIERTARTRALRSQRDSDLVLEIEETCIPMPSRYLEKIVEELVDNAFKFSASGSPVHVRTYRSGHDSYLVVRDGGHGMTPQQISDMGGYVQFDRLLHEQQGIGLGLSIADRIARLLNGGLQITSGPGCGTTVSVRIPQAADRAAPVPPGSQPPR
jgi:two-component system, sensor histidine kinase and response regulator